MRRLRRPRLQKKRASAERGRGDTCVDASPYYHITSDPRRARLLGNGDAATQEKKGETRGELRGPTTWRWDRVGFGEECGDGGGRGNGGLCPGLFGAEPSRDEMWNFHAQPWKWN
ncbi:hypothetical protein GUJ93_ZPchr0011g28798 [Zizania palustris]|uniref:Uncharacterized protein n=1 Tax=Zizania palustris TaxID=103762 RepID=A0A8J6BLF6_ZIZPA|nr:hypothetical protein GUJ93_ZPchr0011g28798 [Zizania palustris]